MHRSCRLPVHRITKGLSQSCWFRNYDRYDEDVDELGIDATFDVLSCQRSTEFRVVNLLLLGDQNAGKSTFLHSFSFSDDNCFTQLSSLIPIIFSSFTNTRFIEAAADETISELELVALARDELPYLDTDIARAQILLTSVDFQFFCDEFGVRLEQDISTTRHILLNVLEFGGDHLNRLQAEERGDDVLRKSQEILAGTRVAVYLANCSCLFKRVGECLVMDKEAWRNTLRRLHTLSEHGTHSIIFVCSRIPNVENLDWQASWTNAVEVLYEFGAKLSDSELVKVAPKEVFAWNVLEEANLPEVEEMRCSWERGTNHECVTFLGKLFSELPQEYPLRVASVKFADVLKANGETNVAQVVRLLVLMLAELESNKIDSFDAEFVSLCLLLEMILQGSAVEISKMEFSEFASEQAGAVAPTTVIDQWGKCLEALVTLRYCLPTTSCVVLDIEDMDKRFFLGKPEVLRPPTSQAMTSELRSVLSQMLYNHQLMAQVAPVSTTAVRRLKEEIHELQQKLPDTIDDLAGCLLDLAATHGHVCHISIKSGVVAFNGETVDEGNDHWIPGVYRSV